MKTLFLITGAALFLAACDQPPPADNAVVVPEAVCSEVDQNGVCVTPDKDLPVEDQKEIANNG
jgi:PBP1b-binding outer membrane lipoprotein LpoB